MTELADLTAQSRSRLSHLTLLSEAFQPALDNLRKTRDRD
jgi:hypothetical protein